MGLILGLIKRIIKLILYFAVFVAIIVLIPNLPPYTTFSKIELEPTQARVGALAPNVALNNIERLYEDKLLGPEAFQLHNGEVYTSLATGEIVKMSPGGHVTFVTKLGRPCTGLSQEHICGRPLGFKIDEKKNQLYIADAYHGIWKVDIKTDKKQLLVSPRVEIEGRVPKLFNDLAVDKNGDLYWTDSSSDFHLKDGAISVLVDPSGRLLHYNAARNESKVLLDKIGFPNGVVISPDTQFVVVAETMRFRLLKYYINGPKKGQTEVFVSGLPGTPDNVRVLPDGSGVLVGLYNVFDEEHPMIARSLSETPLLRKFIARIQRLIEIPFEFLQQYYQHFIFEDIIYNIGHFKSVSLLTPPMAGLLQVDWNGNIVASYYNTDGGAKHISDGIVYGDKLYLGCPHGQNFIAAVPAPPLLKKAFSTSKQEAPKVTKHFTQETPKPTTPKPLEQKPTVQTTTPPPQPKSSTVKPETKQAPPKEARQTAPPKQETKQAPPKQETKQTPPKQEAKQTPPRQETKQAPPVQNSPPTKASPSDEKPKPTQKPAATTPKPAETQQPTATQNAAKPTETPKTGAKPAPDQIPIKEEIPSDTVKPSKETLKVIKKDGPAQIPNPSP